MKKKQLFYLLLLVVALVGILSVPALAVITEEEVTAQVEKVGREAVSGNIVIWFLCAIAFLKASQKIDSFMSSLGISVGHTGGSMLSEAMIATRGLGAMKGFASGGSAKFGGGSKAGGGSSGGGSGAGGAGGGFGGGLAGAVGRRVMGSAMRSVTTPPPGGGSSPAGGAPGGSVPTSGMSGAATPGGGAPTSGAGVPKSPAAATPNAGSPGGGSGSGQPSSGSGSFDGGSEVSYPQSTEEGIPGAAPSEVVGSDSGDGGSSGGLDFDTGASSVDEGGSIGSSNDGASSPKSIGRKLFDRSLSQGGGFATRVVGAVALGNIATTGSITGHTASTALSAYLGGGSGVPSSRSSGGSVPSGQSSGGNPGSGPPPSSGASSPTGSSDMGGSSGGMPIGGPDSSGSGIPMSSSGGSIDMGGDNGSATAPSGGGSYVPSYDNVEIGGGRITGTEIAPGASSGLKFAMYSADQYMEPQDDFSKVTAKDGSVWFKQYAQDAVSKKPYKGEDGEIKYTSDIVKRLPKAPPRKDRI